MAKYLVTGGAGFIGSNIVRKLLLRGESVRIIDDLSTGKSLNIKGLEKDVEFIQGDFTDIEIAKKSVKDVDYVLHHGALASVPLSINDPIRTNKVNASGTLNMLAASREVGVKRFVYAASSSAYSDSSGAQKETNPNGIPKSPYAVQKLIGEFYCKNFFSLYGFETVALRYFNVFGPFQDPLSEYSAVIPIFIKKMIKGEAPTIYGDGETSRDFVFIDNVVDANLKACEASSESAGEVINIGSGKEVTLNVLVEKINKILNTNIKPDYKEARKGDIKNSLADISKAKKLLKYDVTVDFEEGLKKTIEFYKYAY